LPSGVAATLVNNIGNNSIDLHVTQTVATPRWDGSLAGGIWDINTTANWYDIGSLPTLVRTVYKDGMPVLFEDNASNPNGPTFKTSAFDTGSATQLANNYRTFPASYNTLRLDSMNNFNVNLSKSFVLYERLKLQFRAESYNLCNRPLFEAPSLTATASTFGVISSTTNSPRAIQLALRLTF